MRKAIKLDNSRVLADNLKYQVNNSVNNRKISDIILKEQKGFCAYTDEYISRTDARDIEHFNPTFKDTVNDDYQNWFVVKHQWNKEKSDKWEKHQPILNPTANDFEDRIVYLEGDYVVKAGNDQHAKNLISFLKLDDPGLADKRKKYIGRKRKEIELSGLSPLKYFAILLDDDICQVSYTRAVNEEFGVDLWNLID